jgi:hypothetical protein
VRGTDRAAGLSLDPGRLTLPGLSLGLSEGASYFAGYGPHLAVATVTKLFPSRLGSAGSTLTGRAD